ncbi:MAG: beta strand repeat-containing protein, partial [Planctomycetota bacterium]
MRVRSLLLYALVAWFCAGSALRAADITWSGAGADNLWSDAANWSTDTVPGVNDHAIFDGTSTKDCTLDANVNLQGLSIRSGYTGTVTQSGAVTITLAGTGFTQEDGAFLGGSGAITSAGSVVFIGGAFTSTSGVFTVASDWVVSNSPTFNPNGGTVDFAVAYSAAQDLIPGAFAFNNVAINGFGQSSTQTVSGTLVVNGALTLGVTDYSGNKLNGDTIEAHGDVTMASSDFGTQSSGPGTATLEFAGTGAQALNGATAGHFPNIVVNKPSGTLTVTGTPVIVGNWTFTSGTLNCGSSTLIFAGPYNASQMIDGGMGTYGNVTIRGFAENAVQTIVGTLDVTGTLVFDVSQYSGNTLNGGTIKAEGDVTMGSAGFGRLTPGPGSATIDIAGSGAQTLSSPAAGYFPNIQIAKPSGTLTLADSLQVGGNWTYVSGTIDPGSSTVVFDCPYNSMQTIAAGGAAGKLGNVTVNGFGQNSVQNFTGSLDVGGTLLLGVTNYSGNLINGDTILAEGDVTMGSASFGGVHGSGNLLIDFIGAGNQSLSAPEAGYFPNLEVAKPSGTLSIDGTAPIIGNWTYVSGNVDFGTSTLVFACPYAGTQTITPGSLTYANVTLEGDGNTSVQNIVGTWVVGGNLTLGILDYGGNHLNGGTIDAQDNVTIANAGFGTSSGGMGSTLLVFDGSGDQTFNGAAAGGRVGSVVINKPAGTLTLAGSIGVTGDWTSTQGTVAPAGSTVSFVDGTNSNIVGDALFGGLTVNKNIYTVSVSATGNLTLLGDLNVTGRPLNLTNGKTLTVGGNLTVGTSGGAALAVNQAAISLNGAGAQTIDFGGSTVYNLTVNKPSGSTIFARAFTAVNGSLTTFAPGSYVEFPTTGTTALSNVHWLGSLAQPITIRSTVQGTPAALAVYQASPIATYVNVEDSNEAAGSTILAYYSTDAGDNTNWSFPTTTPLVLAQTNGSTEVSEAGTTDQYSLALGFQPQSDVTVMIAPDGELRTDQSSLVFTSANWNVPQTVTVSAVNDFLVNGTRVRNIVNTAYSNDFLFDGATVTLPVTIDDNDVAGVQLVQSGGSTDVTVGGNTDSYTLVLTAEPNADVTITATPDQYVTLSPLQVTFTALNWNLPQTITVTAVEDNIAGTYTSTITHVVTSADPHFSGLLVPNVVANVTGNTTGTGNPTAVALSANPASPVATGTIVTLTANPTGGSNLEYKFLQTINGADVQLTDWVSSSHYIVSPAPVQATTFTYKVECQQVGAATPVVSLPFNVQWQSVPLNSITLVTDLTSPQLIGTGLNMTVSPATGGPTAQYQFVEQLATYTVTLQDWSSSATYALPGAPAAGTRQFFVRARNEGTTVYVQSPVVNFVFTDPDPTVVFLSTDLASPQLPGTPVLLTANVTGGADLEYQFVQVDGATQTILQDYGVPGTITLTTTVGVPESHQYFVNVRSGDTGTPIVSPTIPYAWHATPLTAVALAASPSSPLTIGTNLTLTAAPTGGADVQYQFWQHMDSGDVLLQDYSTVSTLTVPSPAAAESDQYYVLAQYNGAVVESPYQMVAWVPANPTSVTMYADQNSPVPPGSPATFTANAQGGTNVQYEFVRLDGAVETVLQAYGPSNTFTLNEPAPVTRTIVVHAQSLGQATAVSAQVTLTWDIAQPSYVSLQNDTNLTSPALPGQTLSLTAYASGGSNLQYQFWHYDRHANLWSVVQDWSNNNNYTVTPTAPSYGGFFVLVRSGGTTVNGLASTVINMDWTPADPTSLTLQANPATSPQLPGTAVTFTATAGGAGPFQYQFVTVDSLGGETVVQDWNSSNTYTLQPATGMAATFKAYARAESRATEVPSNTLIFNWAGANPATGDI